MNAHDLLLIALGAYLALLTAWALAGIDNWRNRRQQIAFPRGLPSLARARGGTTQNRGR